MLQLHRQGRTGSNHLAVVDSGGIATASFTSAGEQCAPRDSDAASAQAAGLFLPRPAFFVLPSALPFVVESF